MRERRELESKEGEDEEAEEQHGVRDRNSDARASLGRSLPSIAKVNTSHIRPFRYLEGLARNAGGGTRMNDGDEICDLFGNIRLEWPALNSKFRILTALCINIDLII